MNQTKILSDCDFCNELTLINHKYTKKRYTKMWHKADKRLPSWLRTDVEFCAICCCGCGFDMQIGWGATAAVPLLDTVDAVDDRLERFVCGAIGKTFELLDTGLCAVTPTPLGTTTTACSCNSFSVLYTIYYMDYLLHMYQNSLQSLYRC